MSLFNIHYPQDGKCNQCPENGNCFKNVLYRGHTFHWKECSYHKPTWLDFWRDSKNGLIFLLNRDCPISPNAKYMLSCKPKAILVTINIGIIKIFDAMVSNIASSMQDTKFWGAFFGTAFGTIILGLIALFK